MKPESGPDRTYCRGHCKGFRETGGLCFADGACEKYTQYMREQKVGAKSGTSDADVVEAFFKAESLPEGHC